LIALVVEDDRSLQTIYGFILKRIGFEVVAALDGYLALAVLEDCVPALVLLDLRLPHMPGIEVLRYLRAHDRFKQTRVVILSSVQIADCELEGEEFLLKPVYATVIARIAEETRSQLANCS
jgi:two-component system alkaline phosphatase synthesis response regulator PhoP